MWLRWAFQHSVLVLLARVSVLQSIALEVGDHRVPIDELDRNLQELMEVSLEKDCVETRNNIRELHQVMEAVVELLKKKLLATRTALGLGRLSTDGLMAELAEMKSWLEAVDRWLAMQESEPNIASDPGRAHQLLTKYEVSSWWYAYQRGLSLPLHSALGCGKMHQFQGI